jgi:hypothetical protein
MTTAIEIEVSATGASIGKDVWELVVTTVKKVIQQAFQDSQATRGETPEFEDKGVVLRAVLARTKCSVHQNHKRELGTRHDSSKKK